MTRTERRVLVVACLASVVVFLDTTIVNVALPAIVGELGGGLAAQQWIVDAYLLTLGALILVAGAASDVYGRVRVVRVGLVVFGAASVVIALAPDAVTLIVARAVQGVGGALLVPSSLALITATFVGDARTRAIGIWTAVTSAATLAGPVVGGVFVDTLSWRWAFIVNVIPAVVVLMLLTGLRGSDAHRPAGTRIDVTGAVLAVLGLGGSVFALIEQARLGWTPLIIAAGVGGLIALGAFVWRQAVAPTPLMPLALFRRRNFAWGNLATFFVYAALGILTFVIGVYLQEEAGLSATAAGLASLPISVFLTIASARVGTWAGRFGARVFMTAGPLVMAAGALVMLGIGSPFDYVTQLLPGIVVFAIGLTLTVAPLTAAILGAVDSARAGTGSAVNNAVARIAGLLSVALLGPITGGVLDTAGLHRSMVVIAVLMGLGALVSWCGIRDRAAA